MNFKSKMLYWYFAFVAAYLLVTLLPAPDPTAMTKYHLSAVRLRLLDVTLIVPIVLIWLAAFYGYVKIRQYTNAIRDNKDGKQVVFLARGLLVFAIGLPLNSLVSGGLTLIARHNPDFTNASTIIANYFNMLYPLLAYLFISIGARGLSDLAKARPTLRSLYGITLMVIIIGVVFCDMIARAHAGIRHTFHMSYSLVMLTMAIPYMFMWFLGFIAAVDLYQYSRKAPGIVYRHAWKLLSQGLAAIIIVDVALQYLSTLTAWTNNLSLGNLLLLLYVLLLLLAIAFIVVALGTKKLMKIEEV